MRKSASLTWARYIVSFLVIFTALAALPVVFAQGTSDSGSLTWSNLPDIFANWKIGVLAVVGAVHWLRKKVPKIDGPILVPGAAIGIGAAIGAIGQLLHMLTVAPYANWTSPFGGILYGVALAVTGVIGVNLFDLASSTLGKAVMGLLAKVLGGKGSTEVAAASDPHTDAAQLSVR